MQGESPIVSVLGGRRVLGRSVKGALDLDSLIREGIPWKSAGHVKEVLALTDREFAVSLGISERTLGRVRTTEGRLTPVAGDRLYRLARIYALSKEVLEDGPRAMDWLRRPQVGLGGRIPLDMISTEAGAREVENLLGRIEHGVLS